MLKEKVKFASNFITILLLLAILFAYAMFQGGFVSWFLFYSFLPIFLYQMLVLLYPWKKWKITREISSPIIHSGGDITVTLHLERKFPFPLHYLIVEEVFPSSLHRYDFGQKKYQWMNQENRVDREMKTVIFPWFRRKLKVSYTMKHIPRGEHKLNVVRIKTGDVFGLVKKECFFSVENSLIAYPSTLPVQLQHISLRYDTGNKLAAMKAVSNSNIVGGVRDYAPGDRFSWIDWKQTAKKNSMMTKEFEQERNADALIVLNNCGKGLENANAYEATVEMTLTLLEKMAKESQEASFLSVGGAGEIAYFPKNRSRTLNKGIQKYLTNVYPANGESFGEQLKKVSAKLSQSNLVILITTNIDPYLAETLEQTMTNANQVGLILIQGKKDADNDAPSHIEQLKRLGAGVCILTEQQLVRNPIEVTFYETVH